ncbi:MAG: hypothetical protein ACTMIR_12680 [Cellulomonadaceae bacterium]
MTPETWWAVFGWVGSAVLVLSLMQTRITRLRVLNLAGCFLAIAYNAVIEVWPSVGLNTTLAVINIVHLTRIWRTRHAEAAYDVIPVEPSDRYLRHLLDVYREDIERFHPITVADALARADHAYLVVRGEETVGCTLLHREDGDTAHVDLDYVTERWRDFTVSEFVYRRSSLLRDQGFARVVTDAGADPFYARIGFKLAEDRFELTLP